MNKKLKSFLFAFASVALTCSFTACEEEATIPDTSNSDELKSINKQYVENVVLPTYAALADATVDLYQAVTNLKAHKNDANVQVVADKWKSTRIYWEESEAFLFGPVDELGIDPHIDTWPMAISAFNNLMNDAGFIQSINNENGDKTVALADNEDGVLGFHSIEYTIFREGKIRKASDISDTEMIFAVAVAGDLRNQCCLIELGWVGESGISAKKLEYAKRANNYALLGGEATSQYASKMLSTPNAVYTSALGATVAILDGCIDIADEVGSMKIGKPFNGANDEDKNYIESQFSYNSKVDFAGNIRSIENAYLGGIPSKRGTSVSDYLKSKNASLDTQIKTAITDALAKINAIENFEINAQSASTEAAMNACIELGDLLDQAKVVIRE